MPVTISTTDFDAVLFDLDGVVTQTEKLHTVAWKALFDEFLSRFAQRHRTPFVPFDAETDYLQYVDGKQRYDGVASFLAARDITLTLMAIRTTIVHVKRSVGWETRKIPLSWPV